VSWAYLAVSFACAVLTIIAICPPRRGRLSAASFVPGWLVSELPVHQIIWQAGVTALFWWGGAFSRWPGLVGLAITAVSWCGLVYLAVEGSRAHRVFARALDDGLGARRLPAVADVKAVSRRGRTLTDLLRNARVVPLRPRPVEALKDIDYWGDGTSKHRLDIFRLRRAAAVSCAPVFLFIHGGAWVMGDKREQGLPLIHHLAAAGWVCVTLNYRLSPSATWPEHVVDCKRALAWVHAHIEEYGGDPRRIAVSGGSAGGHLAALVALTPGDPELQPGFEQADTVVAACVPLYGVYDFCDRDHEYDSTLMGLLESKVLKARYVDDPARFHAASPFDRVNAGAPPFLVVHGRNDTLVPVRTARSFAATLSKTSSAPVLYVELPRAQHAFEVFWSPRTVATVVAVEEFLLTVLSSRTTA
jgi:acetyl esterase/lipase